MASDNTGSGQQRAIDRDRGGSGRTRDQVWQQHTKPAVREAIDVGDEAADKIPGAERGESCGREPLEAAVRGHPQTGQNAQRGVVAGQPLGITEHAPPDPERPHGGYRHHQATVRAGAAPRGRSATRRYR